MKNNLIGISGKIGSGKDTVGKIIQYLSAGDELSKTTPNLLADWEYDWYAGTKMGKYQIKKYADKLKDIVCLLIGCTREQLEDREFKEKELGEEWNIWVLVPNPDHNLFDGNCQLQEAIFYSSDEAKKYIKEHKIINVLDIEERALTPRKLLQLLGTEAGREIIHPNIWVNALFADYNKPNKVEVLYDGVVDKLESYTTGSKWIITDVRFPNEAKAIKDRGGIVIRVERDVLTKNMLENTLYKLSGLEPLHPSETALDDYEFDHVIENDGSIEDLIEKVKQLNLV